MSWWRRAPTDDKLDRELKFHLEQHASDLIARGLDPAEARRQARLAIGGVDQVKEECRDQRSTRWLSDVAQDARYALRLLRHTPGFAAVTLITLALGTGATTVMFTVIDGVLLKPLPFAAPHELVAVSGQTATWNTALFGQQRLAYLDFRDCQTESRTLDLGGWLWDTATLSEPGDADHVEEASVSASLFPVLGVPVALGRGFVADDDQPGGAPVVIISDRIWREKFGASPEAIGRAMVLDTRRYTVVGVMPPRFEINVGAGVDVFTPLGQNTLPILQRRGPHPIGVIGAAAPGRDAGAGAHGARRHRQPSRGAVPRLEQGPHVRGRAAHARRRQRRRHAVAALRRRDARPPHRVRQHREPAPRARDVARARAGDARGDRREPRRVSSASA